MYLKIQETPSNILIKLPPMPSSESIYCQMGYLSQSGLGQSWPGLHWPSNSGETSHLSAH
jgi:hypothetical protein